MTSATDPGGAAEMVDRDPRLLLLALAGVVATLVGVFSTWATGGPHTLNGVQGPYNGWLAVIYALIGAGAVRAVARVSWLGIVTTLFVAAVVLVAVLDNGGVTGLGSGWGYWLTIAGAGLLAAAGLLALLSRVGQLRRPRWVAAGPV